MQKKPKIISIAGGKGGVGKSFIAANLAIALSEIGQRVVVIDLDIGGANLHTFLGLSNNNPGIGEFVKTKGKKLNEFVIKTDIDNLSFIPGDGITPFMANISFLQKHKLIKNIEKLDADIIILDLGAGSTYNIIDFFNIANRGILVVKPDFLSVISALAFLKNAILRKIGRQLKSNERIKKKIKEIFQRPMDENSLTIDSIINEIQLIDEESVTKIRKICENYRPGIIFNMGTEISEMEIMKQFNSGLENVMSIEADYLGFVMQNQNVLNSIRAKIPFLNYSEESKVAVEIRQIAKRLFKFLEKPIKDSGKLLKDSTEKFLQDRENN